MLYQKYMDGFSNSFTNIYSKFYVMCPNLVLRAVKSFCIETKVKNMRLFHSILVSTACLKPMTQTYVVS